MGGDRRWGGCVWRSVTCMMPLFSVSFGLRAGKGKRERSYHAVSLESLIFGGANTFLERVHPFVLE